MLLLLELKLNLYFRNEVIIVGKEIEFSESSFIYEEIFQKVVLYSKKLFVGGEIFGEGSQGIDYGLKWAC